MGFIDMPDPSAG